MWGAYPSTRSTGTTARSAAAEVRTMFVVYLVGISFGLVYLVTIALLHR